MCDIGPCNANWDMFYGSQMTQIIISLIIDPTFSGSTFSTFRLLAI